MSLGERISALRAKKNWSQGDLAELLDVSRQSISKWETDNSVPELDSLIRLSELFGVSIDELVKGAESPTQAAPVSEPAALTAERGSSSQRITGVILLCFGFLATLLLLLLGGGLFGLIVAAPFFLCGTICLTARRHAGLWCGWGVYLCVDAYLRYATGITWRIIRQTIGFQPEWNYVRLAIGWAQFLFMILLCFCTLRAFRDVCFSPERKNFVLLGGGWAALVGLHLLQNAILARILEQFREQQNYDRSLDTLALLTRACGDYLCLALLLLLLVWSLAALRARKK